MAGVEEEGGSAAALRQQVEALKAELEEERQAAASGAEEALAMILRLQAEKAAERMEAEQFRRVAEERIRHDGDTLAFLKAVVFHQEMEISSLKGRLLAVHAAGAFSPPPADLPWLRKLAKNGALSRRNASVPAARLEELCSELDGEATCSRENNVASTPARTVSDIGEVISREMDWVSRQLPPPPPHRSISPLLRRASSYSPQCGLRSARSSPEIIAEEEESACKSNAALEADVEQIKATVQALGAELTKLRDTTMSLGDAQLRVLTEIHEKLDGVTPPRQRNVQGGHGSSPVQVKMVSREEASSSSSSRGQRHHHPRSEVLMNHFIEAMMYIA